jgi:pimeloyl-[acyl-carrier protein] methyl ester esterase
MQIVFVGGWGFTETHYQPFLTGLEESLSAGTVTGHSPLAQRSPVVQITSGSWYPDLNSEVNTLPSSFIGIGHSLGVAYLLKHYAQNLEALINISGFPCFVKTSQQPYGASPKILRAMQQKFNTHPEHVLQDFYQKCGVADAPLPDAKHYSSFAVSLAMLGNTIFFTPPLCPTLSLHSVEDAIVSVSNTKHFGTETILYQGASHALPLTHTAQIIEDITAFLARQSCP